MRRARIRTKTDEFSWFKRLLRGTGTIQYPDYRKLLENVSTVGSLLNGIGQIHTAGVENLVVSFSPKKAG